MATAATNLLLQTNPLKWKQCYPNRFRLLRPLSAQPVKLSATFNQIKLQSLEKSRLIATNPKSKSATESLQYRPAENPETCVVNKLWKYARKPVTTAAVLLGVLLLMYRPKPALASSVGRVRATCSPYDSEADTESQLRYIDARDYSMSRTSVDTMGWVLYPYALYYGALAALFVMCRLLKCLDPSVLEWFKRQVKFLFLIVIIHHMWATRHNPSTVVKLQLQVNLSNAGRALQTDLNRIAETANTSTYTGVNSILTVLGSSGISLATIEPLTGSNFKKWKADIEIYVGLLNIDICLTEDAPEPITDQTPDLDKVKAQEWMRADRMTKLILKRTMSETVRGSVPDEGTAKDYLNSIAEMYQESEKAETGQLLDSLITMKYSGSTGVREHIMKMIETAAKLRDLQLSIDDQFIVHIALNSLPSKFSQLKTAYHTQKDKWSLNELIAICVQEEEFHRKDVTVNLVGKNHGKAWRFKGKKAASTSDTSKPSTSVTKTIPTLKPKKNTVFKCYFCKKEGHMKRDCSKYRDWLKKRGISKVEGTKKE